MSLWGFLTLCLWEETMLYLWSIALFLINSPLTLTLVCVLNSFYILCQRTLFAQCRAWSPPPRQWNLPVLHQYYSAQGLYHNISHTVRIGNLGWPKAPPPSKQRHSYQADCSKGFEVTSEELCKGQTLGSYLGNWAIFTLNNTLTPNVWVFSSHQPIQLSRH